MPMAIRTALYIRVSSARQARSGASIPDQISRLTQAAQQAGEIVVGIYVDQARSGASAVHRPKYQALLAAARLKEFDRVRVESVDRGHRNDDDRREFEREMQKLGIKLIYNGEAENQAPQHRKFNRGLRGVVAELESDEASQRTYNRHRHRAQQGRWRGGNIPYGLQSDGHGWFEPDPEHYRTLCWILERRAEGLGYYRIAKMLNTGINLVDGEPLVPPTPGLLQYRRKPYLLRQDPETGDEVRIPKEIPDDNWKPQTVGHICNEAVDGVYAGIYHWGRKANRFHEDDQGHTKEPVRTDTGKPLVEKALLQRVRVVELDHGPDAVAPTVKNTFLLNHLLRCGHCGKAIPGYTTSKYKNVRGEKVCYKYRKYRCAGRVNKPGTCKMTILDAEKLEQMVLGAVFAETVRIAPRTLAKALGTAVERRRSELLSALEVLAGQSRDAELRRDEALDSLLRDRNLSDTVRQAISARAEAAVQELSELETNERTLRAGLSALDSQARSVERTLTNPDLDPARWEEPAANLALQRALRVMVRRIEVSRQSKGRYSVKIWLYDAENLLVSESVMSESAWESNPPAKLVTPPTGFEDQGSHRATSALGADCSHRASVCQLAAHSGGRPAPHDGARPRGARGSGRSARGDRGRGGRR